MIFVPWYVIALHRRAARYDAMFGGTHAFLPVRNGIRPNTLHVILHGATALTLAVLGVLRI
jgi:hypothetical protein